MTVLLAVLLAGVLLDNNDRPTPNYYLAFTSTDGKRVEATTTGKDGKFYVALPPGTYRFQVDLNGMYYPELGKAETITVDEKTSDLKLKLDKPLPARVPPMIEVPKGHWYFDIPLQPNPNPPA